MKFIELTQRSGTKIFVRADAILSVERRPHEDVTILYTGGPGTPNPSGCLYVQEEPDEVMMLATKDGIAYSEDFVNGMRDTMVEVFNALAAGPGDKVATAWAAINKKEELLEQISRYKSGKEDSDASCLLKGIYQIAFSKGVSSTEAVLKDKQELLQALCKYKQVYAEQTEPDTKFKDAFLKLIKELCCVDSLCDGDYYLDNMGSALKGIKSTNNFICEVYEALFPDRDKLSSPDVVAKKDEILDEIADLKNTAHRVHECAKAENALYDTQDELRDVNDTLDRLRDTLQDIERALEG